MVRSQIKDTKYIVGTTLYPRDWWGHVFDKILQWKTFLRWNIVGDKNDHPIKLKRS